MAGKLEITDEERALVTAYLIHLLAEPDDDDPAEAAEDAADEEADAAEEAAGDAAEADRPRDADEGGQRRRRRGRDR
jgi:hypothetical protein